MKYEGIVNVLKPAGMTSSDVVVDVRRIFGEKRVGHTGTLDPAAAGALPCCIGRATRLFDYLADKEKEYIAEIRFGIATDTLDAFGVITEKSEKKVSAEELENALKRFRGEIEQIPPIYSSLSINGERMYKLARRGQLTSPAAEKKRRITIYSLDMLEQCAENAFLIKIRCSKGTYIRTLVSDIGKALGVPAYMPFLLRTVSGEFTVENAYTIAELKELKEKGMLQSAVIPCDEAVKNIPMLKLTGLSEKKRKRIANGASIYCEEAQSDTLYRVYIDDEFMGLGKKNEEGLVMKLRLDRETQNANGGAAENTSDTGENAVSSENMAENAVSSENMAENAVSSGDNGKNNKNNSGNGNGNDF